MRKREHDVDEVTPLDSGFESKANELDFDPWGVEEDDGAQRRRDPLRRPVGERLVQEDEID